MANMKKNLFGVMLLGDYDNAIKNFEKSIGQYA